MTTNTTEELKALVAFLNAMHDSRLDGGKMREAMILCLGPSAAQPLTTREIELIDGMIEVQLHHANRSDNIGNRPMAEKQKAWDMERVELLKKLKASYAPKEPLTEERIYELADEGVFLGNIKEIVREIEAAHGITARKEQA